MQDDPATTLRQSMQLPADLDPRSRDGLQQITRTLELRGLKQQYGKYPWGQYAPQSSEALRSILKVWQKAATPCPTRQQICDTSRKLATGISCLRLSMTSGSQIRRQCDPLIRELEQVLGMSDPVLSPCLDDLHGDDDATWARELMILSEELYSLSQAPILNRRNVPPITPVSSTAIRRIRQRTLQIAVILEPELFNQVSEENRTEISSNLEYLCSSEFSLREWEQRTRT